MIILDSSIVVSYQCEKCGEDLGGEFSCDTVAEAEDTARRATCPACGHTEPFSKEDGR